MHLSFSGSWIGCLGNRSRKRLPVQLSKPAVFGRCSPLSQIGPPPSIATLRLQWIAWAQNWQCALRIHVPTAENSHGVRIYRPALRDQIHLQNISCDDSQTDVGVTKRKQKDKTEIGFFEYPLVWTTRENVMVLRYLGPCKSGVKTSVYQGGFKQKIAMRVRSV